MSDQTVAPTQGAAESSIHADMKAFLSRVVRIPIQMLAIGITAILLLKAAQWSGILSGITLAAGDPTVIAILIFAVGIIILGFLWYLTRSGFALLRDPTITAERLATIKDLPLGLPEGTIRAILALIVGIVGLPLLLFMDPLGIPEGTAALVANIITGVFAFYFGQRTGGGDAQATRALTSTIGTLQADKTRLETDNETLTQSNTKLETVANATLGQTVTSEVERIERYLSLADTLANTLGPALPKGLLPDGLTDLIGKARNVTAGVKALTGGEITGDTLGQITSLTSGLLGGSGLGNLLSKASGALLPMAGAGGPLAGVALLLSVGWKLQSAQYRRWRARVLAAPWDPSLIEPGSITRAKAETCLPRGPIFATAFANVDKEGPFYLTLMNDVMADDAFARLWRDHAALFDNDEDDVRAGIAEFRMALLAEIAAPDIDEAGIATAADALKNSANPDLRPATAPTPAELARVLDQSAMRTDVPEDAKAALHSLIMLVGTAREKGVDLPKLLSELPK